MKNIMKLGVYRVSVVLVILGLGSSVARAKSYSLPDSNTKVEVGTNMTMFKKLAEESKALARASSPALVFVSVSKESVPMGMIDPFEFFLGREPRRRPPQKLEGMGAGYFIDLEKG